MTDIMAREALRTTLADIIREVECGVLGMGDDANPDRVAGGMVARFPEVEWELTTNAHGVPVRRLAVKGEWIVDLMPAVEKRTQGDRTTSICFRD